MKLRASARFSLAALSVALVGCASTPADKLASLQEAARDQHILGWKAKTYINDRSAALFSGPNVDGITITGNQYRVTPKPGTRGGKISIGLAAAITLDGYFLTAAHVVDKSDPIWILPQGAQAAVPLRVVWKDRGMDLAIAKADLPTKKIFKPAQPPEVDDPVLAVGRFRGLPSFGKVKHVFPINQSKAAYVVRHDAPLQEGDSGGAVVTAKRRLVGVTSAGGWNWVDAVAPDWNRVWQIIEEDRRTLR